MADVKWIKITTDIFSDEKVLLIEDMPEADAIIVIWFKLLCLAGKQNNSGVFTLNDKIAYTDEMLATIFRRPVNTVRLALSTFENFGMIDILDGVITIPNWEKHQNIDGLEKIREQSRLSTQRYRAKQKALQQQCDVTVTSRDGTDKNRKEEEKNRLDKSSKETTLDLIKRLSEDYNFTENTQSMIEEWARYKMERKEPYKETGAKSLLTQIQKKIDIYGEDEVLDLINECMGSSYKGIIWDRLGKNQKQETQQSIVNKWMNA